MEDITLEKIDMLKNRLQVTYREAKEALERNGGNVIEALIELEGKTHTSWTEEFSVRSGEVVNKVKELVREGNITKIRVKQDDKILAELPIALGAIGAVVMPQLAALGVVAAMFKKCTIEVVRSDDQVETMNVDQEQDENHPPRGGSF